MTPPTPTKTSSTSDGRKFLLINRKFQFTFLVWVNLVYLATLLCTFLATQSFVNHISQLVIHDLPEFSKYHQNLYVVFAVIAIALFMLINAGTLLLSHRIAGPIYRMQTHLLRIKKNGVLKPVQFRKKDFFFELAEAYNASLPENEE